MQFISIFELLPCLEASAFELGFSSVRVWFNCAEGKTFMLGETSQTNWFCYSTDEAGNYLNGSAEYTDMTQYILEKLQS